jgi:hypothetical protein
MKFTALLFASLTLAAISGCGNGGSPAPGPGPKPIDPSGNWSITAADAGGSSVPFAALFSQTGSVVTSNSFSATGSLAPFTCVPFTASLSNGQVLNGSNFTGDVVMGGNFGTFSFNTTLSADGKSFTGTFASMPPCTGLLSSGTFTGAEVPTISGSWTGTITPCTFNQQTGICTLIQGATPGTLTAALSQNDATGNVTGTYQAAGIQGLPAGTVAVIPPSDILSGLYWQFTMTDNGGTRVSIVNGKLDMKGGFSGLLLLLPSQVTFTLVMSH